jgi:hypothetical protein
MRKTQGKVAGALPVFGSAQRSRKRHEGGTADNGEPTNFAVEPLGAFFGMARKASGRTWTFTG